MVNPSAAVSMTEKIAVAARKAAAVGTEILATNPACGPISIEGHVDEVCATPGMLEEMRTHGSGCSGAVIACFDDIGASMLPAAS